MGEFIVFLGNQFFGVIQWLDDIKIIGSLSLLRIGIIILLFSIALKFLHTGGNK